MSLDQILDLVVVGGGAAGFFGAIAAAEQQPGLRILILEKGNLVLGKVLASGGGRCNVTHACFDPAALVQYFPRGSRELRGAFSRFQPRDTIAWFQRHSVALKTEADGRMFPVTDRSQTIVDCLLETAHRLGLQFRTRSPVTGLAISASKAGRSASYDIELRSGERLFARRVLFATGGDRQVYNLVERLGHTLQPPVPSLFTFKISDPRLAGLAGLSAGQARMRLPESGLEAAGPVLVTHWGLSGPAVLRLSAWGARRLHAANYQADLQVSWLPDQHQDGLIRALVDLKSSLPRQRIGTHDPNNRLPQRLWKRLVYSAGIPAEQTWAGVSKGQLHRLVEELLRGKYRLQGKGEFKDEFVTCGGVTLAEVNFKTMESRICPGLYFAGELLDIDGLTGGFNFQSAWTTGWLAGRAIAAASQAD